MGTGCRAGWIHCLSVHRVVYAPTGPAVSELLPLGPLAWTVVFAYLSSLIGVGYLAKRARRDNTLADFYLGGRGIGFAVLFLTLFATTYSGNSFLAIPGTVYRTGFVFIFSLHYMIAIVVVFQFFAPPLKRLADKRGYVTPIDYLQDRFNSRLLSVSCALTMCVALCNYLLAQLVAMGRVMQGLATIDPAIAFTFGVIVLALIMVIYGTLGGLRAVAWTDTIQGVLLLLGLAALVAMLLQQFGSLEQATRLIQARDAATGSRFAAPPNAAQSREWLSYVLIVGFGAALYPHAIQRIYAARSMAVLNRSIAWMAFMPFVAVGLIYAAGVMGLAHVEGLSGPDTDQVLGRMMQEVQLASLFGYWLVVILICAVLAAMMSTADSALLSISSMVSKDIYGLVVNPDATEGQLTRFGKLCSWVLLALLVGLAIALREQATLIQILDRKFDLLVQMVPAFMLGLRWRGLRGGPTAAGFLVGVALSLLLAFGGFDFVEGGKIAGFHPGLVALIPNFAIAVIGSVALQPPALREPRVA